MQYRAQCVIRFTVGGYTINVFTAGSERLDEVQLLLAEREAAPILVGC